MRFKQFYDGWNGNEFLTESWIELQSDEFLLNYLKTKKVRQKTKIAIENELSKRKSKTINNNKEKKSNKPDFGAIADYLENLDEEQTEYLKKLLDYSKVNSVGFTEFSNDEVKFFNDISGLPDRTNEKIYRGMLINDNKSQYKEGKSLDYNHPERNYSSWSIDSTIAKKFSTGFIHGIIPKKGSISVMLKSEINNDTKYIDTYSILMALKYEVNRKKIKFELKTNEIIPDEQEILFVGGKVKSEVIYAKIN